MPAEGSSAADRGAMARIAGRAVSVFTRRHRDTDRVPRNAWSTFAEYRLACHEAAITGGGAEDIVGPQERLSLYDPPGPW